VSDHLVMVIVANTNDVENTTDDVKSIIEEVADHIIENGDIVEVDDIMAEVEVDVIEVVVGDVVEDETTNGELALNEDGMVAVVQVVLADDDLVDLVSEKTIVTSVATINQKG